MLVVDGIFDPFGRNQFPAMLTSSVQQSSLSVEQNNATPLLATVNRVLLLVSLVSCSSLTPEVMQLEVNNYADFEGDTKYYNVMIEYKIHLYLYVSIAHQHPLDPFGDSCVEVDSLVS